MKPQAILRAILVITGLTLIIVALSLQVFPAWVSLPGGILLLAGLAFKSVLEAGGKIKEWAELLGGEKLEDVQSGGTHIEHAEQVVIYQQAEEAIQPKGYIPSLSVETYIPRGQIEIDVRQRLLTEGVAAIVGLKAPGGIGKTELAKAAAQDVSTNFETVLWIDLGLKTPQQVISELAIQTGLRFPSGLSYLQQVSEIKGYFANHKILVVLDDVRPANSNRLSDFLPPSPPCACLVTSRLQNFSAIPLRATYALLEMTAGQAREQLVALLGEEVVRAEAQTADALAERCCFNPMALEIAAKRISAMVHLPQPVAWYQEKLHNRLAELDAGEDPLLNLRANIDISYNDLSLDDQRRFYQLAAFAPTGFTVEGAAAVWGDEQPQATAALVRLLNFSLIKPTPDPRERYRLHDLLDEYAAEKLEQSGNEATTRRAMAEWIVSLFEQHYTDDISTAPQVGDSLDNLYETVRWAQSQRDGELLARLATKPRNWFYSIFRTWEDWKTWLEAAIALGVEDSGLKANVLKAIGDVQQFRDERDQALESYAQALALFRAVGDRLGEANVLQAIGDVQQFRDERDQAQESYAQALALFRAVGDRLGEANVLAALSREQVHKGDLDEAEKQMDFVLQIRRKIGNLYGETADCGNFAIALLQNGYSQRALHYANRCLTLARSINEPVLIAQAENLVRACATSDESSQDSA